MSNFKFRGARVPTRRMGVNLRIAAEAASLFCADTGQDKGVFVFD